MFERLVVVGAEGEPTRRRAARAELSGLVADPTVDAADRPVGRRRGCSPSIAIPRPGCRPSSSPTKRCCASGPVCGTGSPRTARRSWCSDISARRRRSWVELGRDPGALYRGARLEVALDVANDAPAELPEPEREFLDASRDERDREQREAAERVARQARANRRLRIQLAAIAVALVVALVGGFVALDQRARPSRSGAGRAERRVATARELAAAADANLADDPERSMLLALAAIDETRSSDGTVLPEAEQALHRAVTASRVERSFPGVGGALDWSPDGTIFVTEGPEDTGLIDIRDATTGTSVRSFHGHDFDVNDVAFSSDGSMLATTGDDGAVRVWDPATGDELFEVQDDRRGADVRCRWAVVQPRRVPARRRVARRAWSVGVRRRHRRGHRRDRGSRRVEHRLQPRRGADRDRLVRRADRHRDRRHLGRGAPHARAGTTPGPATSSGARTADGSPPRGTTRRSASGTPTPASSGSRSPATPPGSASSTGAPTPPAWRRSSDDGTARISEIADGGIRELLSFSAQDTSHGLNGVAFSPDGERLMTGDIAITAVKIWDASTTGGGEWANVPGQPAWAAYRAADFTPDSRGLVVSGGDGGARRSWTSSPGIDWPRSDHRSRTTVTSSGST